MTNVLLQHAKLHAYVCILQILRNPPPGIDELVALAGVIKLARSEQYQFDRVIIDTAPTGHTLRLLSFPDFLDHFLEKVSSSSMLVVTSNWKLVRRCYRSYSLQCECYVTCFVECYDMCSVKRLVV
jgi:Anion-transporting ATPase